MVRAKELTSRLLTFSKGGTPSLKCSPIFPFAEEVLKTAVNGAPIRCRIEAPETLWNCMYDEVQLRQVLHALTCNAVEAMPKGGELLLTAANVILDKTNRVYLSKGRYIQLTLADQGIGIPENELSHLFNPFFSTKPQGSGLNLAIAHSVLKRHGGSIAVESATGKGTKFHLYLKAAA
jgi:signal transduction histidine kinase